VDEEKVVVGTTKGRYGAAVCISVILFDARTHALVILQQQQQLTT